VIPTVDYAARIVSRLLAADLRLICASKHDIPRGRHPNPASIPDDFSKSSLMTDPERPKGMPGEHRPAPDPVRFRAIHHADDPEQGSLEALTREARRGACKMLRTLAEMEKPSQAYQPRGRRRAHLASPDSHATCSIFADNLAARARRVPRGQGRADPG